MTGPVRGVHTVRCESCRALAYVSDVAAPSDPGGVLRAFADAECPRGGTLGGCPSTTAAHGVSDDLRISTLRDRSARTRRLALPALMASASSPVEVTVTWPRPFADSRYCVFTRTIVPVELLGRIDTGVKIGSLTPEGCILLVSASADVTTAQARIHVAGIP